MPYLTLAAALSVGISTGAGPREAEALRTAVGAGGPVKVWVFLADKGDAGRESLARAEAELHPKTAERRRLRRTAPGLVDVRDLPVAEGYVDVLEGAGLEVVVQSRWLNAVSVVIDDPGDLDLLASLPFVVDVQPVGIRAEGRRPAATRIEGGIADNGTYGFSKQQLGMLNLINLHELGYTGEGVIVGVLDTGFRTTHEALTNGERPLTVIAEYDFINDDPETGPQAGDDPEQHAHGTIILGTMAGYVPGTYIGGAVDASFILCKTEDVTNEYPQEEDFYVAGLEFIEANGGDLSTSSLGYIDWYTQSDLDGETAVTTIAVNIAGENGLHCVTAAGNSGHDESPETSTLIAPADGFRVVTVGAIEPTGEAASYSSSGPTADGRVKPEVMSMGDQAVSIDPYDNGGYIEAGGTSMATPQIAALIACLVDAHPEWTVDQMRQQLIEASDIYRATGTFDPTYVYGFGVPDALRALDAPVLSPLTPGRGGAINTVSVEYATPQEDVVFVYGFSAGSTAVPGCPGLTVEVRNPVIAGRVEADGSGRAALSAFVPAAATGRMVLLAAVEPQSCRVSNVRSQVIE